MIINAKIEERGIVMRKTVSIAMVLFLVFGVSMAYACGEKKTSAEATKVSSEMSQTNSNCSSEMNKASVTPADVKIVKTVETTDGNSGCCPHAKTADFKNDASKASMSCPYSSESNMQKASIEKIGAKDRSCSAASASSAKCLREGNTKANMKAQKETKSNSNGMASSDKVSPEAATLK